MMGKAATKRVRSRLAAAVAARDVRGRRSVSKLGYVYIMTNPSMPGQVKIGYTTRSAESRSVELFTTAVPTPFDVAYEFRHPHAAWVESLLHEAFVEQRVHDKREFFWLEPSEVVGVLELLSDVEVVSTAVVAHRPHDLRQYQRAALRGATSALASGDRVSVISACGTGKTLMQLRFAEEHSTRLTVVATPKIALTAQTLGEWLANRKLDFVPIVVCSDRGAVARRILDGLSDWLLVSTNPAVIKGSIESLCGRGDRVVIFSTHASLPAVGEALNSTGEVADLLVIDEAHRTAGLKSSRKSAALEDIPARRRSFWTATPRVAELDRHGHARQRYSMDDESMYGPWVEAMRIREAIEAGFLCDYQVRAVEVPADVDIDTDSGKRAALHIALAHALEESGSQRCISFHRTIAAATAFAKQHATYTRTNTTCLSVTSRDSHVRRAGKMEEFITCDGPALMANARLFSEGIDAPSVDAVVFVDPKASVVDIVQSVGRALRRDPDQPDKRAMILVPVYTRGDMQDSEIAAKGASTLINVIFGLKAQDSMLARIFEAQTDPQSADRRSVCDRCGLYLHDCACWYDLGALSADNREAIRSIVIERTTEDWHWQDRLRSATTWYGLHDRHPSVTSCDHLELDIATWVSNQRSTRAFLSPQRLTALEAIPGWSWNEHVDRWEQRCGELAAWFERHERHPSHAAQDREERSLGEWIKGQRKAFNGGALPPDQVAKLESVSGFQWRPFDDAWELKYGLVADWYAVNDHHPRSEIDDPVERSLGRFVSQQRAHLKANKLRPDRIAALEAIDGFSWDPFADAWNEMAGRVSEWYGSNDAHPSDVSSEKTEVRLAQWSQVQRRRHADQKLTNEQVDRLGAIVGWSWRPSADG